MQIGKWKTARPSKYVAVCKIVPVQNVNMRRICALRLAPWARNVMRQKPYSLTGIYSMHQIFPEFKPNAKPIAIQLSEEFQNTKNQFRWPSRIGSLGSPMDLAVKYTSVYTSQFKGETTRHLHLENNYISWLKRSLCYIVQKMFFKLTGAANGICCSSVPFTPTEGSLPRCVYLTLQFVLIFCCWIVCFTKDCCWVYPY